MNNVYITILAGGSGTRLWPLSRQATPKQIIKLEGNKTLIEEAIERANLLSNNAPLIVTNKDLAEKIRLLDCKVSCDFLIEPMARGTAAAIFLVAINLYKKDKNSIMVVLTADHKVDNKVFKSAVKEAVGVAEKNNNIVLLGITPTSPETGYGYIKTGGVISGNTYEAEKFVEKPDFKTAENYLQSGDYLWNSGMFIAKTSVFIEEIKKYMPELYKLIDAKENELENQFSKLKEVSIDNGVMEKTNNIAILKTNFSWSDLGGWKSVYDILPKDKNGNFFDGKVLEQDNENTMILANNGRTVAAIGLKDIVVVDTEDATLVTHREKAQDVKKIVEQIKKSGGTEHLEHKTTHRPWGRYTILDEGSFFKVKFIHVNAGAKLSLQSHEKRSEHWVVVKGMAKITVDNKEILLRPNESTFVPVHAKHRLENVGESELTIIEVQTGPYLGEDDIQRFDDDYKRS